MSQNEPPPYTQHFGLNERPFSINPDTRFMFPTTQHKEALAKANYAIKQKMGLSTIYGDIGTGKTTLSRLLVQDFYKNPDYNLAMIVHPNFPSPFQLLREIRREFGSVKPKRSLTDELNELQKYLLQEHEKGKTNVLIIDEAQQLKPPLFEIIRQLLNFETETEKMLQVVLFGQNELAPKIDKMPEFKDRVTIFGALSSLTKADTDALVNYRWTVAGGDEHPFAEDALDAIFRFSGGKPRKLCKLCEYALIRAAAQDKSSIAAEDIIKSAEAMRLSEEESKSEASAKLEEKAKEHVI